MKFYYAIGLTLLFIVILLGIYLIHILYFPVNVIFYSAMFDALIATTLMVTMIAILGKRYIPITVFEASLLICIWVLGGYAFSISVPTVLDRSLSFYILEKLDQRGGRIKKSHMANVFTQEYVQEFRLVDVRLTEQLQSGTIRIEGGCVILTTRGTNLAKFSRFFRLNLLAKKRLLSGVYTDALVDPFKHSTTGKLGYEC